MEFSDDEIEGQFSAAPFKEKISLAKITMGGQYNSILTHIFQE